MQQPKKASTNARRLVQVGDVAATGSKVLITFTCEAIGPDTYALVRSKSKSLSIVLAGFSVLETTIRGKPGLMFINVNTALMNFSLKGSGSYYELSPRVATGQIKVDTDSGSLYVRRLRSRFDRPESMHYASIKDMKRCKECWEEPVLLFNALELMAINKSIKDHRLLLKKRSEENTGIRI